MGISSVSRRSDKKTDDVDLVKARAEFAKEFTELMNDFKNKTGKYAEKKTNTDL
jgi:hypothetical protein